jgi:hypothetical protein
VSEAKNQNVLCLLLQLHRAQHSSTPPSPMGTTSVGKLVVLTGTSKKKPAHPDWPPPPPLSPSLEHSPRLGQLWHLRTCCIWVCVCVRKHLQQSHRCLRSFPYASSVSVVVHGPPALTLLVQRRLCCPLIPTLFESSWVVPQSQAIRLWEGLL